MSRISLLFGPLLAAVAVGTASAQPAVGVVYVSNFTGGQVLAVDTATGATTILLSRTSGGDAAFSPEGMTIGPDGNLYICDSLNGRVWRYAVGQPVGSSNPVVVATFDAGVYPEGPSFAGSDDLYVNTRGSGTAATGGSGAAGIWVLPGVAYVNPVDLSQPATVTPVPVITSIGSAGEGTAFAAPGHLLAVDYSGNRVVVSNPVRGPLPPNYGPSYSPLITSGLSAPVGIATNTCGDVLVSSGNAIRRFTTSKNTTTGDLSAAPTTSAYVTFPRGDVVTFFQRDAANVLWVNTNSSTAGGKVWKILPATSSGGDPIASCGAGVLPSAPLVSFKSLAQAKLLTNSQTQAVGLGIPASDYTAAAKTFTPTNPSQTWNFGHYSVRVDYTQVLQPFTQGLTSLMSRFRDVTFANATFAPGTEGTRFPSLGGFVNQFRPVFPGGVPIAGTQFAASTSTQPAFRLLIFYNDPIQGFRNPGVGHTSADGVTAPYTENQSSDVWTGEDGIRAGSGGGWSKYVGFDEPLAPGLVYPLHITIKQPALSGNPLFNLGQSFSVSIVVTDDTGQPVPGLTIRLSALRFSPKPFVFETVRAVAGSGNENYLDDNGNGKYSINVDTGLFQGGTGTYQFTLFGTGFPPYEFYAQFSKQ